MFAYMYILTGKGIIINIMNRFKWICSWHFQKSIFYNSVVDMSYSEFRKIKL